MAIDPEDYYNDLSHEEWERSEELFVHSVEHENTYPYLKEHLPEEGHILDAGGAAGRYTVWLAENGYKVTLLDISEEQLEIAREKLKERGLLDQVEIKKGDIRNLEFEDKNFDAVLCLGGPLSHVVDDEEREKAAEELVRVAKEKSPVLVSVMGFYASIMMHVLQEWSFVTEIEDFYERQKYDKEHSEKAGEEDPAFTNTYFFKSRQLETLLENKGLEIEEVIGLENVVSIMEAVQAEGKLDLSEEYGEKLRKAARLVREDDAAPDLSAHILAIGYKE